MLHLILSLLVLVLGPLALRVARRFDALLPALDGFIFGAIGGLVLLHTLPEGVVLAGSWALLAAAVGFAGPLLFEGWLHRAAREAHAVALVLALVGLGFHGVLDGMALAGGPAPVPAEGGLWLPLAVILHRIPVGLAIWWLLRPAYGAVPAALCLTGLGAVTVGGYTLGAPLIAGFAAGALGLFQALVSGSLLHVVVHRPHPVPAPPAAGRWEVSAGLGALAGLVLLWFSGEGSPLGTTFLSLALAAAPAFLVGLLGAGLLRAMTPRPPSSWWRGGSAIAQAWKGLLLAPVRTGEPEGRESRTASLMRPGLPPAADLTALLASPLVRVESLALALVFLGLPLALLLIVGAILAAWAVGWRVGRLAGAGDTTAGQSGISKRNGGTWGKRLADGWRYGLATMPGRSGPWLLLGLGVAAAGASLIGDRTPLASLPTVPEIALLALAGMPLRLAPAGAIPLGAFLLHAGAGPGAVAAFLLTGAAVGPAVFRAVSRKLGRSHAVITGVQYLLVSLIIGVLTDRAFVQWPIHSATWPEEVSGTLVGWTGLVLAGGVLTVSLLRQGPRRFVGRLLSPAWEEEPGHHHPPHATGGAPGSEPHR